MLMKVVNKINRAVNIVLRLESYIDFITTKQKLTSEVFESLSNLVEINKTNEPDLIVSLTTYDKRIHDVHLVIESIGKQSIKANRIILWLDESEFTKDSIPKALEMQVKRGLEICFCENYRSYKKLIPTLSLYPSADIITVDDDIIYPYDMIEIMRKEQLDNPDCVIANMTHKMSWENGKISPYKEWEFDSDDFDSGYDVFPVGAGGILYPSGVLSEVCTKVELFTKLAPEADDVWFKAMSIINNKKSKKIKDTRKFTSRFITISDSQDIGLYNHNLINSRNDKQISLVFEYLNIAK
ncbi:glycosyl transferase [Vibrio breoganii]